MAAITWADVIAVAPQVTTVPVAGQTAILAYVNDALDIDEWSEGDDADPMLFLARCYLAAHHGTVTLQGNAGAAGPVISESAGDISRSYAAFSPTGTDPLMDTTPYGKAFRSLARRTLARAPFLL